MREIRFRGRRVDTGEWVYGNLVHTDRDNEFKCRIQPYEHNEFPSPVDPETVGQYTGLKDRNGKDIYEGDIVQIISHGYDNVNDIEYFDQWLVNEKVISHEIDEDGYISYKYAKYTDVVVMDRFPGYWLKNESFGYEGEDLVSPNDSEVIGNIHEHPHLLKGE